MALVRKLEDVLTEFNNDDNVLIYLNSKTETDTVTVQDSVGNHHVENWIDALNIGNLNGIFDVIAITQRTNQYIFQLSTGKNEDTRKLDELANKISVNRAFPFVKKDFSLKEQADAIIELIVYYMADEYLLDGDYCDWQENLPLHCDSLSDALDYLKDIIGDNGFKSWVKCQLIDSEILSDFDELSKNLHGVELNQDFFDEQIKSVCDTYKVYDNSGDIWERKISAFDEIFNRMCNISEDKKLSLDDTEKIFDDYFDKQLSEYHLEDYVEARYKSGRDFSLYTYLNERNKGFITGNKILDKPRIEIFTATESSKPCQTLLIPIEVYEEVEDIREAIKEACIEYCKTDEGRNFYESNEKLNWEDFESRVPNSICEKYGFRKISVNPISVSYDESLVNEHVLDEDYPYIY